MISIVFPHAINSGNDRLLELKFDMLAENTTCEYEVLFLPNEKRPEVVYKFWDWGMRNAKYDLLLWDNSDIVYAPGWNELPIKYADKADWIGLELVECGQIGVHPNNIHKDFGITAETFRRKEFEDWVKEYSKPRPEFRKGFCWYSPSVWKKSWYIARGGFNFNKPFPYPNDAEFKEHCESVGSKFIVVNSFAYHFQRSGENLGQKPERT